MNIWQILHYMVHHRRVVVERETEKPETKRNETRLPKLKRSLPSILSCKKNGTSNFTVVACSLACP